MKLLLDNGANPNAYNLHPPNAADGETQSRITALYHACTLGNEKVVRLLLERGADPWDGESVPHAAESNQRGSLELLLEFGADISAPVPVFDNTSLHFLATQLWDAKRYDNIMGGITWLLEHGADPNIVSLEARETPLHAAATTRRGLDAIRLFLYHGADVNARRADGRTAYTIAIRFGYTEIAELLLSHGANTGGTSPIDQLLGAAMRGAEDEALAILRANPGILEQFVPEDKAMLPDAIFSGTVESLRTMARVGFDLRWENSWGGTALHLAAWFGKIEMVRELLSHDAPVNVRDSRHGSSPIAWAAHGSTHCRNADDDYIAVIRLLLDAGSLPEFATNTWKELSSGMATPAVRRLLREHGF